MTQIVIESAAEFKPLVVAVEEVVACVQRQRAETQRGGAAKYGAFEAELAGKVAAIERAAHLLALEVNGRKVTIDGVPHSRVGTSATTFKTAAGPVELERALYRKDGERNARVVDAVSLRAGVVGDGWLPGAARAMAFLVQQGTSREAEQTALELGRLPYARSSFERLGHEVGGQYAERHGEIEEALIEATEIPAEAFSISVSLDRVSLPMEEPRPRTVGRPRKDAPRRPISSARRWRISAPVGSFQRAPERFIRCATRLLHVASTFPLPTGRPARRRAAA